MYDIIIGRSKEDRERFGLKAAVFIGKQYVHMGQVTSLANKVYLDVNRSHVMLICGKRGGGKSYTLGVIAEGVADLPKEIKQNISVVLVDTMGVYWTMKYPNYKDEELLKKWGLKPKGLDVVIYTPHFYYDEYKRIGMPTDVPFAIQPSDFDPSDWALTFDIDENSALGVLLVRIINKMLRSGKLFDIDDIIAAIKEDKESDKTTKYALINKFEVAKTWGLFKKQGTLLADIVKGGQVTVLDVSCYATQANGWKIKSLLLGLISKKLFIQRMIARKKEEFQDIQRRRSFLSDISQEKQEFPLVWIVVDEAHEFLPRQGKTSASDALIAILREGRQPGINLILATQQPGKIHTDAITQADIVLSHRLTAKIDVDALSVIAQSYMHDTIETSLNVLPRVKGAGILFDDTNERLFEFQIRPRFTWHGGEAPTALKEIKKFI